MEVKELKDVLGILQAFYVHAGKQIPLGLAGNSGIGNVSRVIMPSVRIDSLP